MKSNASFLFIVYRLTNLSFCSCILSFHWLIQLISLLYINRCLDLQNRKNSKATKKSSSNEIIKKKKCSSTGCPFYNKTTIEKLKEKIIFKIYSIEELVTEGKRLSACPYYATRAAIPLSQVIFLLHSFCKTM